jgi:hypothetical protein
MAKLAKAMAVPAGSSEICRLPWQFDFRPENISRCVIPQFETQPAADAVHRVIFWQNVADDPLNGFPPTDRE